MNLIDLGWNDIFQREFDKLSDRSLRPARIAREDKDLYTVFCESGEFRAEVTGKFRFNANSRADFPAVGDWVAITPFPDEAKGIIHYILPRRSKFSRRAVLAGGMPETSGETDEQVLAANIDTVFLVSGLDNDFNLRRIERYLTAAWDSGATPVIVLNKADLREDLSEVLEGLSGIAFGIPVHAISAGKNEGLEELAPYIGKGRTVALLGSSGVGKSTIINRLLGEDKLKTTEVREDDSRGRHTTTHREMVSLPSGGLIIDTPGLRSFKVWDGDEGLAQLFADIEELGS
jgi:ribosome biogenesis GTPase